MKIVKWLIAGVVLLVIVVAVVVYFSLNSIVRKTVEVQASSSLNLQTTLGAADLSLFGGKVKLSDLKVASPPGYTAPEMFTLGSTAVAVSFGQLRQQPIHVKSVDIAQPIFVVEQKDGKFNFKAAVDQMPKEDGPTRPDEKGKSQQPMRLIIDELTIENPTVIVKPGDVVSIPGASALGSVLPAEIKLTVESISLKNIGNADGAQNGAALHDVMMQVVTAVADRASKSSSIPAPLRAMLNLNAAGAEAQLGAAFQKQISNITGTVGDLVKDPSAMINDPAGTLKQGVGDLLGQKNGSTSKPADSAKDIENGLGGLLGEKKKK